MMRSLHFWPAVYIAVGVLAFGFVVHYVDRETVPLLNRLEFFFHTSRYQRDK